MSKATRYRKVIDCKDVRFIEPPAFHKNRKLKGIQREGLRFEMAVQERLDADITICNPWIGYLDVEHGDRICSPDALLVDVNKGVVVVVECKLTHTFDAFKQLDWVYKKVVGKLFPGFEVWGVEVCKHYDLSVHYPVSKNVVKDISGLKAGMGNVMVWNL